MTPYTAVHSDHATGWTAVIGEFDHRMGKRCSLPPHRLPSNAHRDLTPGVESYHSLQPKCWGQQCMEPCLHAPIRPHGTLLKQAAGQLRLYLLSDLSLLVMVDCGLLCSDVMSSCGWVPPCLLLEDEEYQRIWGQHVLPKRRYSFKTSALQSTFCSSIMPLEKSTATVRFLGAIPRFVMNFEISVMTASPGWCSTVNDSTRT